MKKRVPNYVKIVAFQNTALQKIKHAMKHDDFLIENLKKVLNDIEEDKLLMYFLRKLKKL